jgi:hypothetical protein
MCLENIQRVTRGYVWKTYTELRKDTLRKYTASYITNHQIQPVTYCRVLQPQYVSTLRTFSRTPHSRQHLLMFTSISQFKLQSFVLKSLQIPCPIQLHFNTNISIFISTKPYLLHRQHMCTTCHSFYTSVGFVFRFIFSVSATFFFCSIS